MPTAWRGGEEITSSTGQPVKLSRPLDFLVVADHSDNMGLFTDLLAGKPNLMASEKGRRWHDMMLNGHGSEAALELIMAFGEGTFPKELIYGTDTPAYRAMWEATIDAAEKYNDPGHFTAFIGFEWTSNNSANNLHRNVIFRGNGEQAGRVVPMVTFKPYGSVDPADLWAWMATTEEKTGTDVLAIAHNGNLSNGRMFPTVEAFGKQIEHALGNWNSTCPLLGSKTRICRLRRSSSVFRAFTKQVRPAALVGLSSAY